MALIFLSVELLVLIITIIAIVIYRRNWSHQYWRRKGLPYLKPDFFFGSIGNPFNRNQHLGAITQGLYNELKQMNAKHGGLYSFLSTVYLPIDLDILKKVMQKDFNYFEDRGFYHNEKDDPLSAHLFAISGSKWRNLRQKLSPTFTSGKMKMMVDALVQCAHNTSSVLHQYESNKEGIDIKDALARYTIDVIGSCAFGLDFNSFKDEDSEFRNYGKKVFERYTRFKSLLYAMAFNKPNLARKFGFKMNSKEVNDFFINLVKDTVKYREVNNIKRNDMMQLLIDLKNETLNNQEQSLSMNEIAAQAFVFFVAGFETSSTTMTFCLYELAMNKDIQQKVRDEVNNVLSKHGENLSYEAIMDMKYMGQVIDETLRKYPPLAYVTRNCVKDYHVPDTDVIIEKGTGVLIPILGLHYDPDYFPNPEKFDPERFLDINKASIPHFSYIPFGEGPRICIGMRFGLMQVKVGLAVLLKNYIFSLNNKTEVPLSIDRYSFIYSPKNGVWLNVKNVCQSK